MGNICCGYEEESWKKGAWYTAEDKDDEESTEDAENGDSFHTEDDYNEKAKAREGLIEIHQDHQRMKRRLSITSTPMEIKPGFEFYAPLFPKSPETTKFLLEALCTHFAFDSIDDETRLQFVNAMQPEEFDEGSWVMKQGGVGDYFYIVEEGEVAFHVAGGGEWVCVKLDSKNPPPQAGTGERGCTFGELALLYNSPRAASVRAVTSLKLYKIDQITFNSLLTSNQLQDRSKLLSLVQHLSVFENLSDAKVRKLADAFTIVEFGEGERIMNKGDHGNVFYIVKSGRVKVDDIGLGSSKFEDMILEEGECFGERALITGEPRAANVTAMTQTSLLAITKVVVEEIIGPLEQAIRHSCLSHWLSSVPIFANLGQEGIDRCIKYLKEENFKKGDKILTTEGKLYLIEKGHVLMTTQQNDAGGKEVSELDKKKVVSAGAKLVKFEGGDYFIDSWARGKKDPQTTSNGDKVVNANTINVEEDMKCLTLLRSDVHNVIGDMIRFSGTFDPQAESEKENAPRRESRLSILDAMKSASSRLDYIKEKKTNTNRDVMSLSKMDKHRILGVGSFGKVWLVTPKSNTKDKPTPYALKTLSKRQLLKQNLAGAVLREKNVMESIEHPLLLHMVSSFQDDNYLYFVLDLVLGGELFEFMYPSRKKKAIVDNAGWKESAFYKSFGEEDEKPIKGTAGVGVRKVVFFSACIIDALAYLHDRRIVYRDLKPENVLLNEKGYCVVVDMGFAKVVTDKTYTVCGTPEYIAPEVLARKGHNHVSDYWSFACLLYELIVGQTPFVKAGQNQMELLRKIVKAEYKLPSLLDKLCPEDSNGLDKALCHWKDLVLRLLKPRSVERVGNLCNGIEDIFDHDWFANIDFCELRNQSMLAPWIPSIVDPLDMSHFENKFRKQEQPEVFRRKLSSHDQAVFRGF